MNILKVIKLSHSPSSLILTLARALSPCVIPGALCNTVEATPCGVLCPASFTKPKSFMHLCSKRWLISPIFWCLGSTNTSFSSPASYAGTGTSFPNAALWGDGALLFLPSHQLPCHRMRKAVHFRNMSGNLPSDCDEVPAGREIKACCYCYLIMVERDHRFTRKQT